MKFARFGSVAMLVSTMSIAMEDNEAKGIMAFEFAECSAYYLLMEVAAEKMLPPGEERKQEVSNQHRFSEMAFAVSAGFSNEKLTTARIKLALEGMKREMNASFENISIVGAKYTYKCKDLMEHPEIRYQILLRQ